MVAPPHRPRASRRRPRCSQSHRLEDRIEVKGEQESGRDATGDGPEPKRAPAPRGAAQAAGLDPGRQGGTDLTVPLLALAALLAIAFGARGAIRSQRS